MSRMYLRIVPGAKWQTLIVLGATVALTSGCEHKKEASPLEQKRPPAMVTVAPATTREVPVYLDEIGKTLSPQIVAIVPQVSGKVVAVHVVDGAYVQKGQLLFEIDSRPFDAALAAAQASLSQAKAENNWAEIEMKRQEWLKSQNSATQYEYDEKRVGVSVAKAKIEAADAAVASAKLDVEYSKIYSPTTGRAGARLVDPGNIVRANETRLLVVQQLDPIYVEFTVNENDLNSVRQQLKSQGREKMSMSHGLKVEVDLPQSQSVLLAALGGTTQPSADSQPAMASTQPARRVGPREGALTFLDNSVQTAGTVKLRATVPNADQYFWPGQFVNARLILDIIPDAVVIPAQAEQVGQQGPFVYVVGADQMAALRPITPGQRHGDTIVVARGLEANEKVIVTGQSMVMPGGPVMVTNADTGGANPAKSMNVSMK